MCKDINEALLENVIEITWMFDGLMQAGEIKSWDCLIDEFDGSQGLKNEIVDMAKKFEEKYPFETTWVDGELDYISEIGKFAKEGLKELFSRKEYEECEPDMIDGVTTCCGYDFGTDQNKARYCPVCGKALTVIK